MKAILLNVATANEEWAEVAVQQFQQKISHFLPFEVKRLKSKKLNRESAFAKKIEDSHQLIGEIQAGDYVLLFDETGKTFDSIQFSKKIESILNLSKKRLVFVIGGAYGVNDDIKKRADLIMNLSPFTMNHIIAEIVCLEQIYRAFTILKNLPYHNSST